MFAHRYFPTIIKPAELDLCLENGWYRLGKSIFTTHFIKFKKDYFSTLWLRVDLNHWGYDKQFNRLEKLNKDFRVEVSTLQLTEELNALFLLYRNGIHFDASNSLEELLQAEENAPIFTSMQLCIYDGERMIAAGIFDLGDKTAAGISSFYDHAYKKHSLGKYLIYQKMKFCKAMGLNYFYPGYVVPGYKAFDYKLSIAQSSVFFFQLSTRSWLPIVEIDANNPLVLMKDALRQMQQALSKAGICSQIIPYELFDAGLMPAFQAHALFDYPLFLSWTDDALSLDKLNLIVYDLQDKNFHWLECALIWEVQLQHVNMEAYSRGVLQMKQEIFVTAEIEQMKQALVQTI